MNYVDIIWLLIGLLSLASNSFVVSIILSCRKLRNCPNAILCSMLLSSCAISVFYVLPGQAFIQWRVTSIFLCSTIPSIAYASITCYGLHVCASCLDKVISILTPFRHRNLLTARNITILIICLWVIPYFLCAIPFLTYRPYSSKYCIYQNYTPIDRNRDVIFHTVFLTFMTFVPVAGTIILYVVAFIKVNSKKRRRITNASISQNTQRSNTEKNWKIARQMALILGFFLICWLPLFIILILERYITVLRILTSIFRYIAFSYHVFNPILIAYFHTGIRRQIKHLWNTMCMQIRRKRAFQPIPRNNNQLENNGLQLSDTTARKQSIQSSCATQQETLINVSKI